MDKMTPTQRTKAKYLHQRLDELAAEYLKASGRLLSHTTVMELMEWSHNRIKEREIPADDRPDGQGPCDGPA